MAIQTTIMPVVTSIRAAGFALDGTARSSAICAEKLVELDLNQQKAALSLLRLKGGLKDEILLLTRCSAAAGQYTIKEIAFAAATDKATRQELIHQMVKVSGAKATDKLTASILAQIFAQDGADEATKRAILSALGLSDANKLLGKSYDTLTLKQKIASGVSAMGPMGWITLALTALPLVIKLVSWLHDVLTVTAEEARETADELHSAFEETTGKLESLNSELKTSKSRIEELQELSNAGTITLVEQEELENLREEIGLLERRKKILEEQAKNEGKEADAALVEAFNKQEFDSVARDAYTAERDALQEQFDSLVDSGDIEAANELYDRILKINNILAGGYDSDRGDMLDKSLGYEEYIKELLEYYRELDDMDLADMSESQIAFMESLRGKLVDIAGMLQTDWIDNLEVDKETKASWQGLFDEIYDELYSAEQFTKKLEGLSYNVKKQLTDLGSAGDVTAEQVEKLAEKFPGLQAWMDESGYAAEDVAKHFNALSAAEENASKKMDEAAEEAEACQSKLTEVFDTASDRLKSLQDMGDKLADLSGEAIPYDVLSDFLELLPEAADKVSSVSEAQEYLNQEIERQRQVASDAYGNMLILNQNWMTQTIRSSETLQHSLAECYEADLTNFKELADDKWTVEQALISNLSELWQKYSGITTQTIRDKLYYEDYVNPNPNLRYINELRSVLELREKAESRLSELVSWKPSGGTKTSSSSSGGSASREVEEYTAAIDQFREALERLNLARNASDEIEKKIGHTESLKGQIVLQRELVEAYERESEALKELDRQRDAAISAGVERLRGQGFTVEYDPKSNELWIENLERLNELTAESKGEYDTLQEATNALRKETEELIDTITDLNDENRDGVEDWRDLEQSMREAEAQVLSLLDGIVEEASDAVDSIQNVYGTLHDAADEYAESGYITIDTVQAITKLGQKYLAYLTDENGQLVINEERIRAVIAAKTQDMAIESSLSYIEALRIAKRKDDIETLNDLLYATNEAANATWGFVYANLALAGLDDGEYEQALKNINALRALADSACESIGQTADSVTDELEKMQDGLNDILDYVMDMLKQRINDQIDALNGMKDAYADLIDMKKESLEASRDEADYQKTQAKKLREIAKLQARIDALSLAANQDDRKAQAEKAALLEELAELQDDLAETQADKSTETVKNALDDQKEAYEKEKDKEIEILEDSISSYQKLYSTAIEYIGDHWDTLYSELIDWNTEYGSVLNSEITTAWDDCLAAARRYGDYVSALNSVGGDIESARSGGTNLTVGKTEYSNETSDEDMVRAIVARMKSSGSQWSADNSKSLNESLHQKAAEEAAKLPQYGVEARYDSASGIWIIKEDRLNPSNIGKMLTSCYHTGGVVGGTGTLKDNEILAKLEKGETVLTQRMWDNLTAIAEKFGKLSEQFGGMPDSIAPIMTPGIIQSVPDTISSVTNNNRPVEITIGDTIIQGSASAETVERHIEVNRRLVNEILDVFDKRRW